MSKYLSLNSIHVSTDFKERYYIKGLTLKKYRKFMKDVILLLVSEVLKGNYVKLPYNLGDIFIRRIDEITKDKEGNSKLNRAINPYKTQQLRLKIDPSKTKEDWAKLPKEERPYAYYNNDHTNGAIYKIEWSKGVPSFNKGFYCFEPSEGIKKELAEILKNKLNKLKYYA